MSFERVLDNLDWAAQRWPIVIQSMFHTWQGVPPSVDEIDAWVGRIRSVLDRGGQVSEVQIYTVARDPSDSRVGPLSAAELAKIEAAASDLGVALRVSGGL